MQFLKEHISFKNPSKSEIVIFDNEGSGIMEKSVLEVLALIPARSGSKLIPHKNIRLINGKELLAYSIEHALSSKLINRTVVSTDDSKYAEIAKKYGAEVSFLRPSEISHDTSTDLETFIHALTWLKENESYAPDICVHLRPTYPIRRIEDINNMVQILIDNQDIDSVRSLIPASQTPFKMWYRGKDNLIKPVIEIDKLREAYNQPRQLLPKVYCQNNNIDTFRTKVIMEKNSMTGSEIYGYLMSDNFDIDTEEQFKAVEDRLIGFSSTNSRIDENN